MRIKRCTFAYGFKRARKKAGFTQERFAEEYGVSVFNIRKWEQGKATPDVGTIEMLCNSLNRKPEKNFKGDGRKIVVAFIKEMTDKDGFTYYKVQASAGRGRKVTRTWHPEPGWAPKTVKRELDKFAADLENSLADKKILTHQEELAKKRLEEIEAAKLKSFRHYADGDKWRTYIYLLCDSGMRKGEACGLQWSDFDFKANTVTIQRSLQYTPAKGVYTDLPKNGKSRKSTLTRTC